LSQTIDWRKYIKQGNFKSTHGIELSFKWEFDRLETEVIDKEIIISSVLLAGVINNLVVIHTVHPKELEKYAKAIYYPQTNLIKKESGDLGKYIIYDDVITTGKSILKCIEKIGYAPEFCLCIIDRRYEFQKEILDLSQDLKVISIKRDLLGGS
jgi:orotate phosphoribosyltransferase